ncbi:glycosyltransferase family 2 protein [Streptomyces sp. NPDC012794]|uniref:glycosyltransferase family 2 protein n=1 Tax=Streptomyces sp. NPDC012794 TaxID=3364850 RepID=UPI00368912B0
MAKVSICIPVYNRPAEVERAVRSALEQTYSDIEVVVVDNASTDETWDVITKIAESDARVRAYRNDSLLPRVLNWRRSLELSEGEYVKLLFSDDWISPDAVERSVEVLDRSPRAGFVFTAMTWHYERPQTCYRHREGRMSSLEFLVRSATVEDQVPVSASCTLMRRTDLLDVFQDELPSNLPFEFSHGLGLDGTLLWRVSDRYPYVHHIADGLAHSADPHSGEPNTRMQIGAERHEMMWWAYRNAFAQSLLTSRRPAHHLRALRTALLVSCVPLRPTAVALRNFRLFRLMFPGRWWDLAPLAAPVRALVARRLREPLDPTIPL